MKKCEEYQEKISAYIDNELADAETAKLFYHLGECTECRDMLKSMLQLRTALHEVEFPAEVQPDHKSIWKRTFVISYPVAAALALLMLMSGFFFVQKITQPPRVIEKTQTEYVYMTSFPPVYATINSSTDIKSN